MDEIINKGVAVLNLKLNGLGLNEIEIKTRADKKITGLSNKTGTDYLREIIHSPCTIPSVLRK